MEEVPYAVEEGDEPIMVRLDLEALERALSEEEEPVEESHEDLADTLEEEIEEEVSEDSAVEKKSSKKHSSSSASAAADKTVKGSKKSDPVAVAKEELESSGIEVVGEYFDWGWWMSALSQGSQYQTTDITCENTTCTMQVCEKTKCTEYKKECETTEVCDDLGDFVMVFKKRE